MAVNLFLSRTKRFLVLANRRWFLLLLIAVACSHSVFAEEAETNDAFLSVEYKKFYIHLRKLDPEDMPRLHFAFGFILPKTKAICPIENVYIHTPKQDIPITTAHTNRFSLPKERALKLAEAEVHVRFQSQFLLDYGVTADMCNLSVRLEANLPQKAALPPTELQSLNIEFKTFFEKMGAGLFSFMMPEPHGVKLHLKQEYASTQSHGLFQGMRISNGTVLLEDHWIRDNHQNLDLSHVSHITAWVGKE